MVHVILSPHHDDAVLSCGGLMVQLVRQGESVRVHTIMAGDIPPHLRVTPYIQEHFTRWATGADAVKMRKAEDRRAVETLGAQITFGSFPDLIFRADANGEPLYADRDAMFGTPHPDDPVWTQRALVVDGLEEATAIYAPLGVGHHVDHQLVRDVALWWMDTHPQVPVAFYEEYPYSAQEPGAVALARELLPFKTRPEVVRLDDAAVAAKVAAIACYKSQISTFWADAEVMKNAVQAYAMQVGKGVLAERLWQRAG